jgi:hypothetical protein
LHPVEAKSSSYTLRGTPKSEWRHSLRHMNSHVVHASALPMSGHLLSASRRLPTLLDELLLVRSYQCFFDQLSGSAVSELPFHAAHDHSHNVALPFVSNSYEESETGSSIQCEAFRRQSRLLGL